VVRQWKLLAALQAARRGLSVPELADLLDEECSRRTLYRDLEDLQMAGFPLHEEDGRWRVLGSSEGGWTIPVQPTEALGLFLAARTLKPYAGTIVGDALSALRTRLMATLTPKGRAHVARLEHTAETAVTGVVSYDEYSAQVSTIQAALGGRQSLRILYETPGKEPSGRVVDPYCLVYHPGRLYLIAWCHRRGEIITFAVQRIAEATLLEERYEPDPSFDPSTFVRRSFGVFDGPVYRFAIDFHPSIAHLVREMKMHASQSVALREDGWTRLTMECSGLPEVAAWVASFGGKVRSIKPGELVELVRALHQGGLHVSRDKEA
jgi:predicted DNA-binding transcriptional regulator YafY